MCAEGKRTLKSLNEEALVQEDMCVLLSDVNAFWCSVRCVMYFVRMGVDYAGDAF